MVNNTIDAKIEEKIVAGHEPGLLSSLGGDDVEYVLDRLHCTYIVGIKMAKFGKVKMLEDRLLIVAGDRESQENCRQFR